MNNLPDDMQRLYVRDGDALEALVSRLAQAEYFAIDTEFMRERSYYSQLCLIQVATDDVVAIIDPLAIDTLEPLGPLLLDPKVTKVIHAGQQDMEIFHRLYGEPPNPVFDTQVAATLAGFPAQVGYGGLISELLGIRLEKGEQFTDWARRPLTDAQVSYAMDDVIYMPAAYRKLLERLQAENRLPWLAPDFARMSDPVTYEVVPEEMWRRVKRASSLNRRQLGVLQKVAAWRELEAQRRDVPRKRLFSDEGLIEVARRAPDSPKVIASIRGVSEGQVRRYGDALVRAVRAGMAVPEGDLPVFEKRTRLPRDVDLAVDLMSAVVRLRAKQNGVAVPLLATRKDMETLAAGQREGHPLLEGWRKTLVGDELVDLIEGRVALSLADGGLTVERRG